MNRIQLYIEMSGVDIQNGWVGNFFFIHFAIMNQSSMPEVYYIQTERVTGWLRPAD